MNLRHRARKNPSGWRWRLALMLIGTKHEAVPYLPQRPINPQESLLFHFGDEDSYNTVEVVTMANEVKELVPIADPRSMIAPNTFVAVDVFMQPEDSVPRRLVGTVLSVWPDNFDIEHPDSGATTLIDFTAVKAAYWAPMGYRP